MNRLPRKPPAAPRNFLTWASFPLLALVIFGFAWRPLGGGDDFWAHAAIGRWTLEHGRVPTQTLFLWSESQPWIAHAWGTGVWFASLMKWGGEGNGPVLAQWFNAAMCIAPFFLIWRYWRRNAPFSSFVAPLFVLGIWVSAARFHPRPELFTALFLTLLMIFLTHWPRQKSLPKTQIAGVLLLFAVWPNFHGAVAIGLVFLWIAAFAELWQARGDNRLLLLAAVCTLLIFVCNPRGFDYYRVLVPIGSATFKCIDEWKPFWVWPELAASLWVSELVLWAIGLGLWLKNPGRRGMQLGWMLLMLAMFLQARRQLWLTGLTSLMVIVSNLDFTSDDLFRGWRRMTKGDTSASLPAPMRLIARVGVLAMLVCAIAMAFPRGSLPLFTTNPKSLPRLLSEPRGLLALRATDEKLPVKMAAFLAQKAPAGRIFNDYEYSAYLQWALHDKRKLYIDLNNAYPDSLMAEYFVMMHSAKVPPALKRLNTRREQLLKQHENKKPDEKKMAAQAELSRLDAKREPLVKKLDREIARADAARTRIVAQRKIRIVALRPHTSKEGLSMVARWAENRPGWTRLYRGIDGTVWARK